jgi:hypothetical protein
MTAYHQWTSLLLAAALHGVAHAAVHFWDEIPASASTTIPAVVLDDYWISEFQRVNREVAAARDCKLVFFGDSITWSWSLGPATGKEIWEKQFAPYQPLNMGNSGDITPVMLHRVTRGNLDFPAGRHPKVAVLLCGISHDLTVVDAHETPKNSSATDARRQHPASLHPQIATRRDMNVATPYATEEQKLKTSHLRGVKSKTESGNEKRHPELQVPRDRVVSVRVVPPQARKRRNPATPNSPSEKIASVLPPSATECGTVASTTLRETSENALSWPPRFLMENELTRGRFE